MDPIGQLAHSRMVKLAPTVPVGQRCVVVAVNVAQFFGSTVAAIELVQNKPVETIVSMAKPTFRFGTKWGIKICRNLGIYL